LVGEEDFAEAAGFVEDADFTEVTGGTVEVV
jgi:hypothetical protein